MQAVIELPFQGLRQNRLEGGTNVGQAKAAPKAKTEPSDSDSISAKGCSMADGKT
jgi:hypothetical protein